MTHSYTHIVHRDSDTRSVSIEVNHSTGLPRDPHVSTSMSRTGFHATVYFNDIQQLQDYVNECRVVLDQWMTESLLASSIVAESPATK